MSYCQNCQCPVDGLACPRCGGALAAQSSGEIDPSNLRAAARCYTYGPIGAACFLRSPIHRNSFIVRFHAWQSILLWTCLLLYYGAAHWVRALLGPIKQCCGEPQFLAYLADVGIVLLSFVIVPGSAIGLGLALFAAAQRGEIKKVPLLGQLSSFLATR